MPSLLTIAIIVFVVFTALSAYIARKLMGGGGDGQASGKGRSRQSKGARQREE